jgi:hypothetical protein
VTSNDDRLVADYLNQLATAAAGLPADRRDELIEEISAHIAEARAQQAAAGLRNGGTELVLQRLGPPGDIVSAAAEQATEDQTAPLAAGPASGRTLAEAGRTRRGAVRPQAGTDRTRTTRAAGGPP